jgi:hypothetical protein
MAPEQASQAPRISIAALLNPEEVISGETPSAIEKGANIFKARKRKISVLECNACKEIISMIIDGKILKSSITMHIKTQHAKIRPIIFPHNNCAKTLGQNSRWNHHLAAHRVPFKSCIQCNDNLKKRSIDAKEEFKKWREQCFPQLGSLRCAQCNKEVSATQLLKHVAAAHVARSIIQCAHPECEKFVKVRSLYKHHETKHGLSITQCCNCKNHLQQTRDQMSQKCFPGASCEQLEKKINY